MAIVGRILGLLFLYFLPAESSFIFEDCGTNNSIIRMSAFNVLPDPVDLKQRTINISAWGEIIQDIPDSAVLEVKYYNLRRVFGMQLDIPIPCILGKYGSCNLPFCEYMNRFRSRVCPFLSSNEISCECPPKIGSYSGEDVQVEMVETTVIGRFIAKGKYRTEMRLREASAEKELACFKFYTELV